MDIHTRDHVRKLIGMYLITMVNENDIDLLRRFEKPENFLKKYSKYVNDCAKKNGEVMRKVEQLPEDGRDLFYSIISQLGEGFDIVPVDVEKLEDILDG